MSGYLEVDETVRKGALDAIARDRQLATARQLANPGQLETSGEARGIPESPACARRHGQQQFVVVAALKAANDRIFADRRESRRRTRMDWNG